MVALAAAFVIAVLATPAGISGAVLLLPFQVSVLGTPSPAVTPTNLLYNVVATPGALYRYWRQGQTGGQAQPGPHRRNAAGRHRRVGDPGGTAAKRPCLRLRRRGSLAPARPVAGAVRSRRAGAANGPRGQCLSPVLIVLALTVGCAGGIYGIGGGSILAPILIGAGRPPREVAPAALASTFVTSVAGVVTFMILSINHHGSVSPDWPTGHSAGRRRPGGRVHRRPDSAAAT